MGIFSSLSGIGKSIKGKFADEDFRDKLNGIGSALQGDDQAYETYTKRKAQRHSADDVANAIANGDTVPAATVTAATQPLANRPRPNLPMLSGKRQTTFGRRF